MGGGIKYGQDIAKGPPHDILTELAALGSPGFRDAVKFCARTHHVEFHGVDGKTPHQGQVVELEPGQPPRLVAGRSIIGEVRGDIGSALNGCLNLNYSLAGTVDSFDAESRVGRATLLGVYQQAA
jgi:hypothetical protein